MKSRQVDACRRLVASRYLAEGYIHESNIDNGFICKELDPYVEHSDYFWHEDSCGLVHATIRVINYPHLIPGSFPLLNKFEVDPQWRYHLQQSIEHDTSSIVEISALAARPDAHPIAVLDVYRRFWQYAIRTGKSDCLISADVRVFKKLLHLFGDALHQVGPSRYFLGSDTVPGVLQPQECPKSTRDVYMRILADEGNHAAESYRNAISYLTTGLEHQDLTTEQNLFVAEMGINLI